MRTLKLISALITISLLLSCESKSDQASVIANSIIQDVGKIKLTGEGSRNKIVIVFEENHMSRIGQTEIAIMLNRLYQQHGLRKICLEGAMAEKGRIEPTWFYNLVSSLDDNPERQIIPRQFLKEGEISAAEFMALEFSDLSVVGIENESEYSVMIDMTKNPVGLYLFYVAYSLLLENDLKEFQQLHDSAMIDEQKFDNEKMVKAYEFVINTDSFVSSKYELLSKTTKVISTKDVLENLDKIETYAEEKGVKDQIDSTVIQDFQSYVEFYKMSETRSITMIRNTVNQTEKDVPIAMIIGAAHTDLVAELLKEERICFAVVSPLSFDIENFTGDSTNISPQAFIRKTKLQSVDENSLGNFLEGNRKPSPVIDKQWFVSKSKIYTIARRLSILIAGGSENPPIEPPKNSGELMSMYNDKYGEGNDDDVNVDWGSVVIGPDGLLVAMDALDEDKNNKRIWVKVTKISGEEEMELSSLEQQLLSDLEDLKEGKTFKYLTENKIEVKKIAHDVLAVFSLNQQEIASINMQAILR